MVWKHLKKPAILVASLALAVGIAPMVAFADDATPEGADNADIVAQADDSVIDSVSITVTPPTAGTTPANAKPSVSIPDNANYGIEGGYPKWTDSTTGVLSDEASNTSFVEGQEYYMLVHLLAGDGYTFSSNPDANVSGGSLGQYVDVYGKTYAAPIIVKAVAASNNTPTEDADEPAANDKPAADEPAATDTHADEKVEETPAATTDNTSATETSTTTQATTSSTNTTASTLPKTADALPVALFGGIALMSALVLAMAWRLRRN